MSREQIEAYADIEVWVSDDIGRRRLPFSEANELLRLAKWAVAQPERGTCATCRHLTRNRLSNDEWEAWCAKIGMELNNMPDDFGCSLRQPTEQP